MIRFFCVSQGSSLPIMHGVVDAIDRAGGGALVGHYVADRRLFRRFAASAEIDRVPVWKEWELYAEGRQRRPGAEEIRGWEERLGIPSLWPALMSDRRVMHGPLAKVRQQYAPRFSLAEMQGIVVHLAEAIWQAFERTRPDVVLGFIPVTVGDYVAHLVAEAQGRPHLKVKSTKIANYVTLTTDLLERHPHIRRRITEPVGEDKAMNDAARVAREYLRQAEEGRVSYEGAPRPAARPGTFATYASGLRDLPRAVASDLKARRTALDRDPQRVPALGGTWERGIRRQRRIRVAERVMAPRLMKVPPDMPYVFLPLNSEPEVALSVYSRFTLNQIEVARNVAQSLPLGTILLVKEHPRSWGLRTPGYYRRLAEIPNLRFVHTDTPTVQAIQQSRATVVVSGFAAFEAVLQRVPVITIGHTLYDALPSHMLRRVHDFDTLPKQLEDLCATYRFDEEALGRFVAAVVSESVPVDLYGALLAKPGRETGTGAERGPGSADGDIERFARYVLRRAQEELARGAAARGPTGPSA